MDWGPATKNEGLPRCHRGTLLVAYVLLQTRNLTGRVYGFNESLPLVAIDI